MVSTISEVDALAQALAARPGLGSDHGVAQIVRRITLATTQDWQCTWCELPITAVAIGSGVTHVDHVIPRARGGPNAQWNKELLHRRCNLTKKKRMTARAWALAADRGIAITAPDPAALGDALRYAVNSLQRIVNVVDDLRAAGLGPEENLPDLLAPVLVEVNRVASLVR